jgi:hypothetical protein
VARASSEAHREGGRSFSQGDHGGRSESSLKNVKTIHHREINEFTEGSLQQFNHKEAKELTEKRSNHSSQDLAELTRSQSLWLKTQASLMNSCQPAHALCWSIPVKIDLPALLTAL